MIKKITNSAYIVGGEKEAGVVSFDAVERSVKQTYSLQPAGKEKVYARWFNSCDPYEVDKEPQILLDLAKHNNLQMPLLNTNVDFCIGNGIGLFKKVLENGKTRLEPIENPEVQKWLDDNDAELTMQKLASDFYYTGNYFLEGVKANDGTVASIQHQHPIDCRAAVIDPKVGKVEYYFIGDFICSIPRYYPNNPAKSNIARVPVLDVNNPADKWLWHGRQYFPGQKYYGIPQWWGVKTWIKLSNQIPVFHLSGLTKGYNMRWHIKIPINYFEQFPEDKREAEEDALLRDLDALLSGAENVGKAFISKFSDEKKYPEWKIEALKGELYDDAYKDIFMHSNTALSSANGVDPSLAGYDTAGKLSSGSEKKNSYNIHVALKTPRPRAILFKWLYDVKKLNKWPEEIIFQFKDFEITTTDVNPTGVQNTVGN